jgi:hypothetical protein
MSSAEPWIWPPWRPALPQTTFVSSFDNRTGVGWIATPRTARLPLMTPYSGQTASEQTRLVAVSLVSVLVGGVCGWAAAFSGLRLWGLALGAVITVAMLVVLARRGVAPGPARRHARVWVRLRIAHVATLVARGRLHPLPDHRPDARHLTLRPTAARPLVVRSMRRAAVVAGVLGGPQRRPLDDRSAT